MIKEAYCSEEVSKLLEKKGFHESCTGLNKLMCKNNEKPILCITHQKAMAWLREVYNIHIATHPIAMKGYNAIIYDVADFDDYGIIDDTDCFLHPEEAVEAALKYCLENLI